MKKSAIFTIIVLVLSITILALSQKRSRSNMLDLNVALLAESEEGNCHSGGPGSTQCSINAGTTIIGVGVSAGCSVTCGAGYYACCGLTCTCIQY